MDNSLPLRVMSYNIRIDTPSDGDHVWSRRRDHLYELLKFHKPDVIGIQEALDVQIADLEREFSAYLRLGVGRDSDCTGEYAAIFFNRERLVEIESVTYWLSESPDVPGSVGWDAAHPRTSTVAKLADTKNGRRLYIVSTHFDHAGKIARENSAELVATRTVAQASREALPLVLLADLNCSEGDPTYERFKRSGLQDARGVSLSTPYGPPDTYIGPGFNVRFESTGRYDYIFVSKELQVWRFATLTDNYRGVCPSDHYPVVCDIEL